MLPVTQASLVSRMRVIDPPRGVSVDLARYVQREYGANAAFARAMIARGKEVQRLRMWKRSDSLLRRFVASITETFARVGDNPGGT